VDVRGRAAALVASGGAAGLALAIRGIAVSRDERWRRHYPRFERRVDQRWSIPIAMFVDTLFALMGLAANAIAAYWVSLAVVVALQVAFIAAVLTVMWFRHR
jgi:Na+/glutamate symporter